MAGARGTPLPRATDPAMTEAEYLAALADLDAQRAALTAEYVTSQTYPRWAYHATEPPQMIHSDAEALALGDGWSATPLAAPPVVTALEPDTAAIGAPSFTLHVLGTGFAPGAVIVFAGHDEPTTVVSPTDVTTGVNMAVWLGPDAVPVLVRNPDGAMSEPLDFTFTDAASAGRVRGRGRV
jgi:hypothetical protein